MNGGLKIKRCTTSNYYDTVDCFDQIATIVVSSSIQLPAYYRWSGIKEFTKVFYWKMAKIGNTLTLFYLTLTIIEILKKCVPRVKSYLSQ